MKTTLLSLLILGVLVTGCNEKVSPDLDTGAATSDTAVAPSEYVFEVVNDSDPMLNYKLHRTGPARGSTACKVSRMTNPLTNTQYTGEATVAHDLKNYDITCFFEAEELSLYFSGIDFTVKSSQNTCDYIGYSPFSYFNYQPGSSTTTLNRVNCEDGANSASAAAADGQAYIPTVGLTGVKLFCGQAVDNTTGTPVAFTATEDIQAYCKYDYSASGGPNCDTGVITVNDANCAIDPGPPSKTVCTPSTTTVECGGSVVACVDGPIKKVASLSSFTTGTEISESELNKPMEIKYSLEGGIKEQRIGNTFISNYRRDLANPNVDFIDSSSLNLATYKSAFTPYLRLFDPLLMETYARNRRYGGTANDFMIPPAVQTAVELGGPIKTKPLAADPYMGIGAGRINPFYTFYCFDRSFDIKARIRMVVRDWDRVFSSDVTELEKLTDLVLSEPRQDNNGEEVIFDPASYNEFNDLPDWDDYVPMKRTNAPLSTAVVWEPMTDFFSPDNFPQE